MTVKELIEKLSKLPEDTEVNVGTDCGGTGDIYIFDYDEEYKSLDLITYQ